MELELATLDDIINELRKRRLLTFVMLHKTYGDDWELSGTNHQNYDDLGIAMTSFLLQLLKHQADQRK